MNRRFKLWQVCLFMTLTYLLIKGINYIEYVLRLKFSMNSEIVFYIFYKIEMALVKIIPLIGGYFVKYRFIKCPKVFYDKSYKKYIDVICLILSILINSIIPAFICIFSAIMAYPLIMD